MLAGAIMIQQMYRCLKPVRLNQAKQLGQEMFESNTVDDGQAVDSHHRITH